MGKHVYEVVREDEHQLRVTIEYTEEGLKLLKSQLQFIHQDILKPEEMHLFVPVSLLMPPESK